MKEPPDKPESASRGAPAATGGDGAEAADDSPAHGVLPHLLGYALRKAQVAVFQDFARLMASAAGPAAVSPGEYGLLVLIEANPGISQTALARAIGVDRSTMVPILDRLERRGLVERRRRVSDRRTHALALGAAGRRAIGRLHAVVQAHEDDIARDLSKAERALLVSLLQRLRRPGA